MIGAGFLGMAALPDRAVAKAASYLVNGTRAAVFHGTGVCKDCPESVAELLREMGCKVVFVREGELTSKAFSNIDLYVQPGGSDRLEDTIEALKPAEIQALREFVQRGGRYLGICAGAYLAGETADRKQVAGFGLLPIRAMNESESPQPRLEPVVWLEPKKRTMYLYFQDGPFFDLSRIPGAEIYGTYQRTGHVAAFMAPSGKGKVGLIGPHVEADEDWFKDDHLEVPPLDFRNLGKKFIAELVRT